MVLKDLIQARLDLGILEKNTLFWLFFCHIMQGEHSLCTNLNYSDTMTKIKRFNLNFQCIYSHGPDSGSIHILLETSITYKWFMISQACELIASGL